VMCHMAPSARKGFDFRRSPARFPLSARPGGFTLLELMVSLGLLSIVMTAAYSVYHAQLNTVMVQESRQEAQEYVRSILHVMVRELRNAGYAPTGASCAGIVVANSQSVQFRSDLNGDGDCSDTDEDITYTYDAGTKAITRQVAGSAAETLTDSNATALQFSYFPQNCTNHFSTPVGGGATTCPSTAGGNSGALTSIKRVSVSLTIQSKNPHAYFGGGQISATMVSNADLRNVGVL
jgi:prepilin-type N-terminal cleavage/methylation domain-containing protein